MTRGVKARSRLNGIKGFLMKEVEEKHGERVEIRKFKRKKKGPSWLSNDFWYNCVISDSLGLVEIGKTQRAFFFDGGWMVGALTIEDSDKMTEWLEKVTSRVFL